MKTILFLVMTLVAPVGLAHADDSPPPAKSKKKPKEKEPTTPRTPRMGTEQAPPRKGTTQEQDQDAAKKPAHGDPPQP